MVASVGLVSLLACASKPETEIQTSKQAIQDAKSAEADVYAAEEYAQAEETMAAAEQEIAAQDEAFAMSRSYDQAKQMLATAKNQAEAAASTAKVNRQQIIDQLSSVKAEARTAIDQVSMMMQKAPKGKGTRADLEAIAGDIAALETSYAEAEANETAGKYKAASDQLQAIISKAGEIQAEIEQAIAKKAG